MAVVSLNTNLSSLQIQRRLAESTSVLSKCYEGLSSGLRVSRASDDAAGLAVSSGLDVDSRIFSQARRNVSDGVSITRIAEGALNELTNIVTRLQELAQQSANGTLGVKQRASLDAEGQALATEYFRIARTTEFNGQKLFDGSLQGLTLQVGYGERGALQASLGGKLGTGSFQNAVNYWVGASPRAIALGDLNGDGASDVVSGHSGATTSVSVLLGNGDGTLSQRESFGAGDAPRSVVLGDLNGDGILDLASANYDSGGVSILIGNGDGTFKAKSDIATGSLPGLVALADFNSDGNLDIAASNYGASTVSIILGNGNGVFRAKTDLTAGPGVRSIETGDLNADGSLDIVVANAFGGTVSAFLGNGDGGFKAKSDFLTGASPVYLALGDLDSDGALDIAANWTSGMAVLRGNGDGSFKAKYEVEGLQSGAVALGDLNGDGALDIVDSSTVTAKVVVSLGNGDGTFGAYATFSPGNTPTGLNIADLNRDGVLDIITANSTGTASIFLGTTRDGISPLLDFSLKTKADALQALPVFKQALYNLSAQRGTIGANQSRLATSEANVQVAEEIYSAASSQIKDIDVATETARLLKTQILQKATSSVLAQANQAPALALALLTV